MSDEFSHPSVPPTLSPENFGYGNRYRRKDSNGPVRTHTASGSPTKLNVASEGIQLHSSTHTFNSSNEAIEQRIPSAWEAARARKNARIVSLARDFDVPIFRLRARLQDR
ncbi:hypothetical protein N7453_004109 [Penicillium expansum]|nr:hypothetical protein N7453_004109 [Penicillium expansum]